MSGLHGPIGQAYAHGRQVIDMAEMAEAFGAVVRQIVDTLSSSDVGRIFWLNLCAQLREGIVDEERAAAVLERAWNDYSGASGLSALPQRDAALLACIVEACTSNDVALTLTNRIQAFSPDELSELRIVIEGQLLWQYYLEADADGLATAMRQLPCGRSLHDVDESQLAHLVLDACWRARVVELHERFGSLARETSLRTRASRLWAVVGEAGRPLDAERLVQRLGLSSLEAGAWVVELVYSRERLRAVLAPGDERFLVRPTAFCVNDLQEPRFRGLARHEVGARARGDAVERIGRTVDLDGWTGDPQDWRGEDGLPEIACPALRWHTALLPDCIRLIGPLVRRPDGPDNEQFAQHLEELYRNASGSEEDAIRRLASRALP
jgi:hypothetical protein